MLGQYIDGDILDDIDTVNYFQEEKCLKMLTMWKITFKQTATFARLARGLKEVMREDLIHDIEQFIPKANREIEEFRLTTDDNGDIDMCELEDRFMAQKNSKKQTAHVTFQFVDVRKDALVFVLPSLDDIRVLKELCVAGKEFLISVIFV